MSYILVTISISVVKAAAPLGALGFVLGCFLEKRRVKHYSNSGSSAGKSLLGRACSETLPLSITKDTIKT
jgi:hypothetical protein